MRHQPTTAVETPSFVSPQVGVKPIGCDSINHQPKGAELIGHEPKGNKPIGHELKDNYRNPKVPETARAFHCSGISTLPNALTAVPLLLRLQSCLCLDRRLPVTPLQSCLCLDCHPKVAYALTVVPLLPLCKVDPKNMAQAGSIFYLSVIFAVPCQNEDVLERGEPYPVKYTSANIALG